MTRALAAEAQPRRAWMDRWSYDHLQSERRDRIGEDGAATTHGYTMHLTPDQSISTLDSLAPARPSAAAAAGADSRTWRRRVCLTIRRTDGRTEGPRTDS